MDELILPEPEMENVFGGTPPVDVNVKLPFTESVIELGAIVRTEFTVTVEFAVAPNESVTRTTVVPAVAPAVKNPDDEFMTPPPETTE